MSRYSREEIDEYIGEGLSYDGNYGRLLLKQLLADQDRLCEKLHEMKTLFTCTEIIFGAETCKSFHDNISEILKEIRG